MDNVEAVTDNVEPVMNNAEPIINTVDPAMIIDDYDDTVIDSNDDIVDNSNAAIENDGTINICSSENANISQQLAEWSIECNITSRSANKLLKILHKIQPSLPKDIRALRSTPRQHHIEVLAGGNYMHYGLQNCLTDFLFSNSNKIIDQNFKLQFGIDGITLHRSSKQEAWPILLNIVGFKNVYLVACYVGKSKPNDCNAFLEKLVEELKDCIKEGFTFNQKLYRITVHSFICDTPAKSFILNIKGHSGFNCCNKCLVKGEKINHSLTLLDNDASLRSNESFANRTNENHHKSLQPLAIESLNIGCVTDFPLDYMHLACLGIMKQLLHLWAKSIKTLSPKKKVDFNDYYVNDEEMETEYLAHNYENAENAENSENEINKVMMNQFGKMFKLMEDQTNEIKSLKRAVEVLGKEVYSLKEEVKQFKKSSDLKKNNLLPTLPFQSKECFLEFEDEVKANQNNIQTTLNEYFISHQSADLANFIKLIFKKLLTDNVAKSFTWLGLGGNIAIKNFTIITILKDAVATKFPCATMEETDRLIKKVFYNTKGRLNKSAKNITSTTV